MSRIFLSCASAEFGHLRDMLIGDLRRPNVEVKSHDEIAAFVSGETTLEKLDTYIAGCDAVVQLVGEATGSAVERAELDAILRRHPDLAETMTDMKPLLAADATWRGSYSQWEAYLALYHGRHAKKRLYLYRSVDRAAAHVRFVADDTGRRRQLEHWERFERLGRDRHDFASREDLRVKVLNHLLEVLSRRSEPLKAEPSTLWKLQKRPDSVFEGREQVLANLDALWAEALAEKAGHAQIVSLVAIGGAGKTTVVSRWKDALLAREGHGVERYFDWSFYSQGTRRAGDNASAQTAGDATVFVAAALTFFGDPAMADSAATPWDKGARLAPLISQHRTLLILDGLEPLQHPPGPLTGELKDDAIRALFAGLQSAGRGLCVVTTREPIADLAGTRGTTTPEWRLDHLTDTAGAAVLRGHGVIGPSAELEAASRDVKGHALTLSLMGRFLKLAFDPPDVARRDCFEFGEADAETSEVKEGMGNAFRVLATYERWFDEGDRHVELAILRLLGLFDRPATPDALDALCAAPVIPGLTEPLVGLAERQWNAAIQRLRELDLIETAEWAPAMISGYEETEAQRVWEAGEQGYAHDLGDPHPFRMRRFATGNRRTVDAHPLLREYFGAQLEERAIAPTAHARLYEHLCASVPYWPEGRDGLLPLYQAVAHGCKAGRYQEACDDVYFRRIKRGAQNRHANYSNKRLGLLGLNLAALACLFVEPWRRIAAEVEPAQQGWLLTEASWSLRGLNRLAEAREPTRASLEIATQEEDWVTAATSASNLSQLELVLGDVPVAEATAAQAVAFADRGNPRFKGMVQRTTHADALHHAGRPASSLPLFTEAEAVQAEQQPDYPLLYSVRGYKYCDLLVAAAERIAWRRVLKLTAGRSALTRCATSLDAVERRAAQTLDWATDAHGSLVDIALDNLTLGRVHLLRAVLQRSKATVSTIELTRARERLENALATLRQSNRNDEMPRALLPDAWLNAVAGEWDAARQRLDEAFALATRGGHANRRWEGGMRLHLVDTLLHRARLFGMRTDKPGRVVDYPWPGRSPALDLTEAADLIDICGYHRRDEELADARAALDPER